MIYYTQLLYVNEGGEQGLRNFEERTIPILARHGGRLILLSKVDKAHHSNMSGNGIDQPDEIHLLSFPGHTNFLAYMSDAERTDMLHLKENAVKKVMLFAGQEIAIASLKNEVLPAPNI